MPVYNNAAPKKVDITTTAPQTKGAKDHSGTVIATAPLVEELEPPEEPV